MSIINTDRYLGNNTTVNIRKETKEHLKSFGVKGETYDALIVRILEKYQKMKEKCSTCEYKVKTGRGDK